MNSLILVHPGLEKLTQQEVKEIIKTTSTTTTSVVQFSPKKPEDLLTVFHHLQSARRILISFGKYKNHADFAPEALNLPWRELFPQEFSFKIEVEGVKGQETRFALARTIAGKLFSFLEKKISLKPAMELKKPDFCVVLFFNGTEYFIGLDLAGAELNSRHYRVFTHQASIKGDLAYLLLRTAGFKPKEKLLVGFAKDGTIAIEAALYANSLAVQQGGQFSWKKCPMFKDAQLTFPSVKKPTLIYGFDENRPSIEAARKNALLAKAKPYLDFQKYSLEELDVRYGEKAFDRMIVQLTAKDEKKLHELFYQVRHILKKKGTILLFTATSLNLPTPEGFRLKKQFSFARGESAYSAWLFAQE